MVSSSIHDTGAMDLDGKDPKISIAAGIIIGLAASCVQSLGLTIQRKSHVLNQALPEAQQRAEHRRPCVPTFHLLRRALSDRGACIDCGY